jgi:hypothetical protein
MFQEPKLISLAGLPEVFVSQEISIPIGNKNDI